MTMPSSSTTSGRTVKGGERDRDVDPACRRPRAAAEEGAPSAPVEQAARARTPRGSTARARPARRSASAASPRWRAEAARAVQRRSAGRRAGSASGRRRAATRRGHRARSRDVSSADRGRGDRVTGSGGVPARAIAAVAACTAARAAPAAVRRASDAGRRGEDVDRAVRSMSRRAPVKAVLRGSRTRLKIVSSQLGRIDEPVAGARLGEQVARARRVGLDLAPQVRDVDVQVVRLDLVRRAPHLAQQRRGG